MTARPSVAILAILATLLVGSCRSPLQPEGDGLRPFMRTDARSYTLATEGDVHRVSIGYTYVNGTGRGVHLANCGGNVPPYLEKRVGPDEWVVAWSPVELLCLSEPVVIPVGSTFTRTLEVVAGRAGSDVHPQFEVAELAGVYRLVWSRAYHDEEPGDDETEPLPLGDRVSNAFELRTP